MGLEGLDQEVRLPESNTKGGTFMRKSILVAVAAFAATAFATPALAWDLTLTRTNNTSDQLTVSMRDGSTTRNTWAGSFDWTVTSQSGSPFSTGDSVRTFCTELHQFASNPMSFTDAPLEDIPNSESGMGAAKAAQMQELYGRSYSEVALGSGAGRVLRAAFQLAVWEIAYETSDTLSVDGANSGDRGSTYARSGTSRNEVFSETYDNKNAVEWANMWLAAIDGSDFGETAQGLLAAGDGQDMIIMVPLPAPAMMAGLGLLGVVVGRRRLMNSAS